MLWQLIEVAEARLGDQEEELLELVKQILPPPPTQQKEETTADENQEKTKSVEQNGDDANKIADKEQVDGDGEVAADG